MSNRPKRRRSRSLDKSFLRAVRRQVEEGPFHSCPECEETWARAYVTNNPLVNDPCEVCGNREFAVLAFSKAATVARCTKCKHQRFFATTGFASAEEVADIHVPRNFG